ncbi:MAG: hypothetical protein ACC662_10015 [Planctomycetota bacterium]
MRSRFSGLAVLLLLGACRVPLDAVLPGHPAVAEEASEPWEASEPAGADAPVLGVGAAPGSARGPGGFVPRGSARNFYAGAGGRLWYYMNNYYWAPPTAPAEDLWIKAEVVEEFHDLRRWPDGAAVAAPGPQTTVEDWKVGPRGRSVRLDNHKDYVLLSDQYTAGVIVVGVTLTLGRLVFRDARGRWGRPRTAYVLESRNYSGDGGVGSDRTRFSALPQEAVTVWGYRVPWSTHPQRTTRSNWQRLGLPEWSLRERRPPLPPPAPVITPSSADP